MMRGRGFDFLCNEKHSVNLEGNLFCQSQSKLNEQLYWRQPCWKGIYYIVQCFSPQHLFRHVDPVTDEAVAFFRTISFPFSGLIEPEDFREICVFCGGEVTGCSWCKADDPVGGWPMWANIMPPFLVLCSTQGPAFSRVHHWPVLKLASFVKSNNKWLTEIDYCYFAYEQKPDEWH